jgi:LysR family transcriptional regulator for metE and metH
MGTKGGAMNLTTRDLLLVTTISDRGTLTSAARHLFLTQSALSHQLSDLETRVGAPVFHRSSRRMTPTLAGQRIIDTARTVLDSVRELEESLLAIVQGRTGLLRVTTQCYTSYRWLPTVLSHFRQDHPGVDVHIVPEAAARPAEAVLDGTVDLALAYEWRIDPRLAATPLFNDEVVLIVSPQHPYARLQSVDAFHFADQHLLVYVQQLETNLFHRTVLAPAGVVPKRVSEVRLTEGIVALVTAGVGVAVSSRWAVAAEIASGQLSAVRIGRKGLRRHWHGITLKGVPPNGYLKSFLDRLSSGPEQTGYAAPGSPARRIRIVR